MTEQWKKFRRVASRGFFHRKLVLAIVAVTFSPGWSACLASIVGALLIQATAASKHSAATAVSIEQRTRKSEIHRNPIPSTYFGMHVMDPHAWPSVPFASLGKGTGVSWPYIEQTRGHFNWDRVDEFVNLAKAHGVSILFSGSGVPPWAAADKSTCHKRPPFGSYCSSNV